MILNHLRPPYIDLPVYLAEETVKFNWRTGEKETYLAPTGLINSRTSIQKPSQYQGKQKIKGGKNTHWDEMYNVNFQKRPHRNAIHNHFLGNVLYLANWVKVCGRRWMLPNSISLFVTACVTFGCLK